MSLLPGGWTECTLGQIVEVLDSRRVPLNSTERAARISGKPLEELFPYYGATGQVGLIDDFIFDEPLVLLGEDGVPFFDMYKRKAYCVEGKTWVNNHAHVLKPIPGISNKTYVEAFLNSFDYEGYAAGTTRLKLTQGAMNKIPVPLAPLPEQKRIADKLGTVLARVDACRDRLDRLPALLKRFRQSILASAMSGRLTQDWRHNNDQPITNWQHTTIGDISTVVRGASPRPAGDPKYFGGDCPWITVGEITKDEGKFLTKTNAFVTNEGREKSRYIETGTLLLTNSGATLGVPKVTLIGGCINDGSVALLGIDEPLKSFLYWHLKGLTEYLRGLNQGAAQPNLNTGIVKAIELHLPTDDEQHEIVRRVDILFAFADRLEARLATARRQVAQLTPALLAKAFRGELVPQDPADEPASELLRRLAAQRAAVPPAKRVRKA